MKAWIFQAKRYFDIYGIAETHKLSLTSFYIDGEDLEWYQWLFKNKQLVGWNHFTEKDGSVLSKRGLNQQRDV